MLDKIRLLSAGDGGDEGVLAGVAEQLKSLYRGNDEMIAQLEEMDISSLFSRLEVSQRRLTGRYSPTIHADGLVCATLPDTDTGC